MGGTSKSKSGMMLYHLVGILLASRVILILDLRLIANASFR
jgi:hypothetical protein